LCHNLSAQSKPDFVKLTSYLNYLESEYNLIFSYADEELKSVSIPFKKEFESNDLLINYLSSKTPFDYMVQEDKSVLLIPKAHKEKFCIEIINRITKEIIPNAHLKSGKYIFHSDDEGRIMFPVYTNTQSVRIYADDYINREYFINKDFEKECTKLSIIPFYQSLDEVILTKLLTSGIQKIASGGLEINYDEFGLLPGLVEPDVLQSLQALPGIMSPQESVTYLNVRGGTHDQNLFLWDGIKMYSTSHFFGMISAFNPYMTEKVKLVKNGTSAKYGDGVSSLINMQTSNRIADSLETSVGLNFINADLFLKLPVNKKSAIELSTRHSVNSLWESPTYKQYFDKVFQNTEVTNFETSSAQQNNEFNFFDTTISYKNRISDSDFLKLNFLYAEDDFNLNRFDIENQPINTRSSSLGKTNLAVGLFYEKKWSELSKTQLQFYTSEYNLEALNVNLLNQQSLEQINEVNELGLKLNFQTKINARLNLESGYQINETGILNSQRVNDPGFFSEIQNSILTNSLYSQLNFQSKNKKLNLNLGGRLNHYSKFNEFVAEPRFNLSYEFIEDLFLEVLAEEKSQVTSQTIDLQTDFLGVENRRWVLSDPGLRPIIQSQQFSAGLNFIKPKWFINLDFYYKKVDGITTQSQGFQNQFEFAESHGSYDVRGFDILVNKNFEPFSGWVSYSFSENIYTFEELIPSSFHNNLDIRHIISTGLSFEKNGLIVSSGFNWHSGVPTTLLSDNQENAPQSITYQEPNTSRLKDYFRLDLSSTYTFKLFKNTKALAGISFLNILNNGNIYNQFYLLNSQQDIQTFRQNGLGFTPNFLMRFSF
jgi:hypothetical protein